MTMEEFDTLRQIRALALAMIGLDEQAREAHNNRQYRRVGDLLEQRREVQRERSALMFELWHARRHSSNCGTLGRTSRAGWL